MAELQQGFTYETRDGKTINPKRTLTGNYYDKVTNRHFTPAGGCIAYYRGDEPIIEEQRSVDPEHIAEVNNYDGPKDDPNPGEPPISNEERLRSGMVKPR